jgi:hypothetical protein
MGGEGEESSPLNWIVGALAPGSGAKSGGGCRRRRERAGEREVCVWGGARLPRLLEHWGGRIWSLVAGVTGGRGRVGYGGGGGI